MTKEPPRKLSVDALNGHDPDLAAAVMKVRVWLDGEEQKQCLAYDIDAGTVERIATDEHGKVVIDPLSNELVHEVVRGSVEARWMEPA